MILKDEIKNVKRALNNKAALAISILLSLISCCLLIVSPGVFVVTTPILLAVYFAVYYKLDAWMIMVSSACLLSALASKVRPEELGLMEQLAPFMILLTVIGLAGSNLKSKEMVG